MHKSVVTVLICSVGALSLVAAANWVEIKEAFHQRMNTPTGSQSANLQRAEMLFDQGDLDYALAIVHDNEDALDYRTETGKRWVDLLTNISSSTDNAPQLLVLYENFPQAFDSNEKISKMVANQFIIAGRGSDYELLRAKWKGREQTPQDWLVLDADYLVLNHEHPEALKLLSSQSFDGPDDTGRLVRLALLSIPGNTNAAWDYLSAANVKDPKNPDIHTYRAGLLESAGKIPLALAEYTTAVQTEPNNIMLKDQLAEFYLRNNDYYQAMTIWLESYKESSYEPLLVKALFWNHVITPIQYDWKSLIVPKDNLQLFVNYLMDLPQSTFWDESLFNRIHGGQRFLLSQQYSVWLRLLQDLKEGKEKEADYLFQFNPLKASAWGKNLAQAFQRILLFRKHGTLNLEALNNPLGHETLKTKDQALIPTDSQDFFNQLEIYAAQSSENGKTPVPAEIKALLNSPEAFTAALLTAGWFEAALQLNRSEVLANDLPDWVAVKMTQALRINRNDETALAYAAIQNPSNALSQSISELLALNFLNTGSVIEKLQKFALYRSDVGVRASKMIALLYIEDKNYALAEKAVDAQPLLANDVTGKELKARLALLKGNEELAVTLYTSISGVSAEAKSFLAQRAYSAKDWNRAKELTEQLIQLYPNNALLEENLKKINIELKG
jgi:hypothetical protein